MAQPLDDRIASALKPGARLVDVETTLTDALAEQKRVQAAKADAEERRADPALTSAQATEADLEVKEAELRLIRLGRAVERLAENVKRMKSADRDAEHLKRFEQAEARRNKLVDELREKVGPAIRLIAEYCQRVADSDKEIETINRALPQGKKGLLSAEQVARGYVGYTWGNGGEVVMRLGDLRLPHFDRPGSAWPDLEGEARRNTEAIAASRRAMKKAEQDREASKQRFFVRRIPGVEGNIVLTHADGMMPMLGGHVDCWLYPEMVKAAERRGLEVEPWTEERANAIAEQQHKRKELLENG